MSISRTVASRTWLTLRGPIQFAAEHGLDRVDHHDLRPDGIHHSQN